jgi:hypothetical protein
VWLCRIHVIGHLAVWGLITSELKWTNGTGLTHKCKQHCLQLCCERICSQNVWDSCSKLLFNCCCCPVCADGTVMYSRLRLNYACTIANDAAMCWELSCWTNSTRIAAFPRTHTAWWNYCNVGTSSLQTFDWLGWNSASISNQLQQPQQARNSQVSSFSNCLEIFRRIASQLLAQLSNVSWVLTSCCFSVLDLLL